MAYSGVDKFPQVAKILIDMRMQELSEENTRLRQENQKLQLMLFWKIHGIEWLRTRIYLSMQTHIKCKCRACYWHEASDGECNNEWECALKQYFKKIAEQHGFSVACEDNVNFVSTIREDLGEGLANATSTFCTGDVHFVLASSVTDWVVVGYGEKLSMATSVDDPAVIKLKLFSEEMKKMWIERSQPPA